MFSLWKKKKKCQDIDVLMKKAKEGDTEAQFQLGLSYYRGTDIEKNIEKANFWLNKVGYKHQDISTESD
jgi:TPR repeat protein